MKIVVIDHVGGRRFRVVIGRRRPRRVAIAVPSTKKLQWYLEDFLEYPFDPRTQEAGDAIAARDFWGRSVVRELFPDGVPVGPWTFQIRSDDASVLAWPWEVLRDDLGALGLRFHFERRLRTTARAPRLDVARDRLDILLVTARPREVDVKYRSVSGPLLQVVESTPLNVTVHVLRPPTFAALAAHLRERRYHVVHFDGHGHVGRLEFERDDGTSSMVPAAKLGALLREHHVPAVVLNACQSATTKSADKRFASVAFELLKAGIRSVTAMSYALYVSGAEVFLPAFYQRLLETGHFGEATHAGRQAMFENRERVCVRGRFELEDWIVPVLYQGDPCTLPVARPRTCAPIPRESFVGRDEELLLVERAFRSAVAVVVQGHAGVGKTTFARVLVRWLSRTDGIDDVLWLDLRDTRTAFDVLRLIGARLVGPTFDVLPFELRVARLGEALRTARWLLVWDNFEVLAEEERPALLRLVHAMRGTPSRVLVTSRRSEAWLDESRTIPLRGFSGEELWQYVEQVEEQLGIEIDRSDRQLRNLLEKRVGGHPLMTRMLLLQLANESAVALDRASEDIEHATLVQGLASVPAQLQQLLLPIAFHERYFALPILVETVSRAGNESRPEDVAQLLVVLEKCGLVMRDDDSWYELHPALATRLASYVVGRVPEATRVTWERAFTTEMALVANQLAPRGVAEQRRVFERLLTTFEKALELATIHSLAHEQDALLEALASYAQNTNQLSVALARYEELAELRRTFQTDMRGAAVHQTAIVLELMGDERAEARFHEALALNAGNAKGHASALFHLGTLAAARGELTSAETLLREALAIARAADERGIVSKCCHRLGMIAEAAAVIRNASQFTAAREWYEQALVDAEPEDHVVSLHQLATIALRERRYDEALETYSRIAIVFEQLQKPLEAAVCRFHSAMIIRERARMEPPRGDLATAEREMLRSLNVFEALGHVAFAANAYSELARIAKWTERWELARDWYEKSLVRDQAIRNHEGIADTCRQLSQLAERDNDFRRAEELLRRAIANTPDWQ